MLLRKVIGRAARGGIRDKLLLCSISALVKKPKNFHLAKHCWKSSTITCHMLKVMADTEKIPSLTDNVTPCTESQTSTEPSMLKSNQINTEEKDKVSSHSTVQTDEKPAVSTSDASLMSSKRYRRRKRKHELHQQQMSEGEPSSKAGKDAGLTTVGFGPEVFKETEYYFENGLRKVYPYKFTYVCYCKERWKGKTILQMLNDDFFYENPNTTRNHLKSGAIRVNGKVVSERFVLKAKNELISNVDHRHELPVTDEKIKIIELTDDVVVINKPASIPVHPCGRYRHNSIVFILAREFNLCHLRPIFRLDRLTSGILIFGRNNHTTNRMQEAIREHNVSKTYLARVEGQFPSEKIECEAAMERLCPKIGTWIVKPGGKECHTSFELMRYDSNTNSSLVKCRPYTGRTHQIRVHLQYLGHPIVNDPLYNDDSWGSQCGKNGEYGKTEQQLLADLTRAHSQQNFQRKIKEDEKITPKQSGSETHCQIKTVEEVITPKENCSGESNSQIQPTIPVQERSNPESLTCIDQEKTIPDLLASETEKTNLDLDERLERVVGCEWCDNNYKDPESSSLLLCLHALSYQGPDWYYETEEPFWVKHDWTFIRRNIKM